MNIQSVSLDVPAPCFNNCPFCVSRMDTEHYKTMMENLFEDEVVTHILEGLEASNLNMRSDWIDANTKNIWQGFADRLGYLRDNAVDTIVLTGSRSEPVLNHAFLEMFFKTNLLLSSPFKNIELQTSGICLEKNIPFLQSNKVKTIALSLSSYNDQLNQSICNIPKKYTFDMTYLCNLIKYAGFNLRLTLNMNKIGFVDISQPLNPFDSQSSNSYYQLFDKAKDLGADQLTFRRFYLCEKECQENDWISSHQMDDEWWNQLNYFIQKHGTALYELPFGAMKYDLDGISVVIDNDCMGKNNLKSLKYAILRRNGRLYSQWDSKGSLIF